MSIYRYCRCIRCYVRYSPETEEELEILLANPCKVCSKGQIEEEAHD